MINAPLLFDESDTKAADNQIATTNASLTNEKQLIIIITSTTIAITRYDDTPIIIEKY